MRRPAKRSAPQPAIAADPGTIGVNDKTKPACYFIRMDRRSILQRLAQAHQHIALADRLVMRQRDLVERLERAGHDAAEALRMLANLEDLQRLHLADRIRLERELANLDEGRHPRT